MSSREQFEAWMTAEQWLHGSDFEWDDLRNCYSQFGIHLAYKAWQAETNRAESKCAALAAETHGFKRFFMFAINAAFDGCDITGDQIQEVAKEIGLVRVEPYSAEKHADMSGDPSIMEEGDDFYIMNKTPATDAFLAEVRASEAKHVYDSILDNPAVTDMGSLVDWLEQYSNDSASFAAQLRQGAAL